MRSLALALLCCTTLAAAYKQPQFFARRDYSCHSSSPIGGYVSIADVNGDGILDVVCVGAETVDTLLGNGNGTFRNGPSAPEVNVENLGPPVPVDLNGDGKIDVVLAGGGLSYPYGLVVYIGDGDGTFQQPVFYPADSGSFYTVVADFNGDGKLDAVVGGSSGFWLFTGNGNGTFNPGVLTIAVSGVRSPVAADFNGDGKLDLAWCVAPGAFQVAIGNGDGTFQTPVNYPDSGNPTWLAAGDLNRDGNVDLVVGNEVYLNNGKGTFAPVASNPVGPEFAIGDVNGDHIPDLVSSIGQVALGFGDGHFATPKYYPVQSATTAFSVALASLRKNGRLDIITADFSAVSVLLNEGKGKFEDGITTPVPNSGSCGASADFNGDGIPDLAVPTTTGIAILLGTGKANSPYTTGTTIPLSSPGCPITGDLNSDGIPDLLQPAGSLGGVGVYIGNGDGTFKLASVIPFGVANNIVLGDFNHDGIPDVATSSNQFALGNGDGTFLSPVPILTNPPPLGFMWIGAGDMNNDGWTDIVATEGDFETQMYVLLNNQQGGFTTSSTINNAVGLYTVLLADLNHDGNLDVVVETSGDADIYLGNGKGQLKSAGYVMYPGSDPLPPQIGDVNGDGIPDLILPADGSIGIAIGKGNGTFFTPFAVGAGGGEGQILLANQHGQSPTAGLPDLISPDGSQVWVLLNVTK